MFANVLAIGNVKCDHIVDDIDILAFSSKYTNKELLLTCRTQSLCLHHSEKRLKTSSYCFLDLLDKKANVAKLDASTILPAVIHDVPQLYVIFILINVYNLSFYDSFAEKTKDSV